MQMARRLANVTRKRPAEPGYHLDVCPRAVEKWLKEQGVICLLPQTLANYLHFRYYDRMETMTRNWELEDQGIYSMEGIPSPLMCTA